MAQHQQAPSDEPRSLPQRKKRTTTPRLNKRAKDRAKVDPMLPPSHVIQVAQPGSSKEKLTQDDIKLFHKIDAQFQKYKKMRDAQYAKMQEMVMKGAIIEDLGPNDWQLGSAIRKRRYPHYRDWIRDNFGKAKQQEVLDNTPPREWLQVMVYR